MVLGETLTGKRPVERTPAPEAGADPEPRTELMWEAPKDRSVRGHRLPRGCTAPGGEGRGGGAFRGSASEAEGRKFLALGASLRSPADRRPTPHPPHGVFATAFVLVGLAVAGFATWRIWERQIPGGRPTVAVADFANETGDRSSTASPASSPPRSSREPSSASSRAAGCSTS